MQITLDERIRGREGRMVERQGKRREGKGKEGREGKTTNADLFQEDLPLRKKKKESHSSKGDTASVGRGQA